MRQTTVLCLLLAAAAASAGVPDSVDPAQIPNYKLLTPGIVAAGQPAFEVLPKLGAMGFKTVINLRMPGEWGPDERAAVEGQGLGYLAVPVTPASFSLADVAAIEKALADPGAGPVLIHCASSNRVGAAWAVIQAHKGKDLDAALALGREAGLRPGPMEDAVRRVLAAPPTSAPPP